MGEGGHLRTFCGLLADSVRTGGSPLRDMTPSCGYRLGQQNEAGEPGGMAPSPNRLTAAGTQTTGKRVRDVASSRPLILGGRHQPDYALPSGTFADTARPRRQGRCIVVGGRLSCGFRAGAGRVVV